tara:strand:- start:1460 stop:1741 length:282 start_codon:yes stop_codon:yes gene_type:complete
MAKYLNIPVTGEQKQLVSADGVVLVEQGSTTTVTINYAGGKIVTLTHATAGAGDETQRDKVEDSLVKVQQQPWHQVVLDVADLPYAVSGIAIA